MKKFLALILMLCLLAAQTALAGEITLSAYGDAELLELLAQVRCEIVARHLEKTAFLNAGSYVGGRDIPVGAYILKTAGSGDDSGVVSLSAPDDPEDAPPSKHYDYVAEGEELSVYMTIEEGDVLCIDFPHTLTVCAGVVFQ